MLGRLRLLIHLIIRKLVARLGMYRGGFWVRQISLVTCSKQLVVAGQRHGPIRAEL